MRRYRAAIFKYAILLNVALALYVLAVSGYVISQYFADLAEWTEWSTPSPPQYAFDGPVQPHPRQLVFAWATLVAALVLILSTIASVWRSSGWNYWLRIFSYLAILWVIWFQALSILAFFIDEGAWRYFLRNPTAIGALLLAFAAGLLLAYNISYRPAAGAPSR